MSETPDLYIHIPAFDSANFIEDKTKYLFRRRLKDPGQSAKDSIETIKQCLTALYKDEHQIQLIELILTHTLKKLSEHQRTCKMSTCKFCIRTKEVLCFLYGKLTEFEIAIHSDSFSLEDIDRYIKTLDDFIFVIVDRISYESMMDSNFKPVPHINEMYTDLRALKTVFHLGKKLWHRQLAGTLKEYARHTELKNYIIFGFVIIKIKIPEFKIFLHLFPQLKRIRQTPAIRTFVI